MKIDINADLGESFGAYRIGMDRELMAHISSANIACGFHAGDPLVMEETLRLAGEAGVAVGAHPGYPDLQGFGRRNMDLPPRELKAMVKYQIAALSGMARAAGLSLQHVKAHGALYNMASKDETLAQALAEAVKEIDPELILLAPAGSCMSLAGKKLGLKTAAEVFADRAYRADGSLAPRSLPGAVIHDPAEVVARGVEMVLSGRVRTIDGSCLDLQADSVCVHGDNPAAVSLAEALKKALTAEGVQIAPLREVVRV